MMRVQLLLRIFGVFVWLLTVFLSAWRQRRQRQTRVGRRAAGGKYTAALSS